MLKPQRSLSRGYNNSLGEGPKGKMAAKKQVRKQRKLYLYRRMDVWAQRDGGSVVCYRCFEVLPGRKYCVQSKDFFYVPLTADQLVSSEAHFIELLEDIPPEKRSKPHDMLEEAIAEFERSFM
jgi:hypothetical protein